MNQKRLFTLLIGFCLIGFSPQMLFGGDSNDENLCESAVTMAAPTNLRFNQCFSGASSFPEGDSEAYQFNLFNPTLGTWYGKVNVLLVDYNNPTTQYLLASYTLPPLNPGQSTSLPPTGAGNTSIIPAGTYYLLAKTINSQTGLENYPDANNCTPTATNGAGLTHIKWVTITAPPPTNNNNCVLPCNNYTVNASQYNSWEDEALCAARYLECLNIINGGNTNPHSNIIRGDLAMMTHASVFGNFLNGSPNSNQQASTFADNFPTVFTDLQMAYVNQIPNGDYYKAAKALSYLEYGDGKSPFDRNNHIFDPGDLIQRAVTLKVLLEAWNIPLQSGTPSFSDVGSNHPYRDYIYTAQQLGIVQGSGGNFYPQNATKRFEAFLMLYRLMSVTPNFTPNNTDFFIPTNLLPETLANGYGLDQGNFNHYTKTGFNIPGLLPLNFSFSYNSVATEIPDAFVPLEPLGSGWTHTYNTYFIHQDEPGTDLDRRVLHWADGTYDVYRRSGNSWTAVNPTANYQTATFSSSQTQIITKDRITYTFKQINGTSQHYWPLVEIKDRNNNKITLSYTIGGYGGQYGSGYGFGNPNAYIPRLTQVKGPSGRKLTFSPFSNLSKIIEKVTDEMGRSIKFSFSNAQLASFLDAEGRTTKYYYQDALYNDLLTRVKLPKGNYIDATYEDRKLKSLKTSSNSMNLLTQISQTPNFAATNETYLVSNITQPSGEQVKTLRDPIGRLNTVISNDPPPTIYYNDLSNPMLPTKIVQSGVTVNMVYDVMGNLKTRSTQAGGTSLNESFTYYLSNDIKTYTNPEGNVTKYFYDSNWNLKKVDYPIGETNIAPNSNGTVASVTNAAGISASFDYDNYGNVEEVNMPLGITSKATYDIVSRLKTQKDPNGNQTKYTYDDVNNLRFITNALGHITQRVYDDNDNLVQIVNAKGNKTHLTYDGDNDLLENIIFQGDVRKYTYYNDGKLKGHETPNGVALNHSYDSNERLKNDGYAAYTYNSDNTLKTLTHNTNGGKISLEYDAFKRMDAAEYNSFTGNRVEYTYDNNSNVKTIRYPGNKVVTYYYDANDRLYRVRDWNNRNTYYYYHLDGRIDYAKLGNNTRREFAYDAAGRMTGMTNKKSNGTIISQYTYDLDYKGNHLQEEQTTGPYGLPSLGNENTNYTVAADNTYTFVDGVSFGYDDNGNNTSRNDGTSFDFDKMDNLLNAAINGFAATYTYDGTETRRTKTVNGQTTHYVMDVLHDRVLMETDANGTPKCYYVYGFGLVERIAANGSTTNYYHYDFRGSTIAMTDQGGAISHKYQYDDFGQIIQEEEQGFANPFKYVGEHGVQFESNDLYFMRARYYEPKLGRFLSEDPIWNENLYAYSGNDPINYVDYNGERQVNINSVAIAGPLLKEVGKLVLRRVIMDPKNVSRTIKGIEAADTANSLYKAAQSGEVENIAIEVTASALGKKATNSPVGKNISKKIGEKVITPTLGKGGVFKQDGFDGRAKDMKNLKSDFGDAAVSMTISKSSTAVMNYGSSISLNTNYTPAAITPANVLSNPLPLSPLSPSVLCNFCVFGR